MVRLTDKSWRNLDPWECCGQDNYCKRGCHEEGGCNNGCIVPRLYSRLARYEDLGLLPEEVDELLQKKSASSTKVGEISTKENKEQTNAERSRIFRTTPHMKTIRQVASMGILSEHSLRIRQKQGRLPGVFSGNRFLVDVDMLVEVLREEAETELKGGNDVHTV